MRLNGFVLSACIAMIGGFLIYEASTFPVVAAMAYGPGFFPKIIGSGFVICAVVLTIQTFQETRPARADPVPVEPGDEDIPLRRRDWLRLSAVLLAIVVFVAFSGTLGFLLTVFLLCLALNRVFSVKPLLNAVISVTLPVLLFVLFQQALRVPLPRGIIESWLF